MVVLALVAPVVVVVCAAVVRVDDAAEALVAVVATVVVLLTGRLVMVLTGCVTEEVSDVLVLRAELIHDFTHDFFSYSRFFFFF